MKRSDAFMLTMTAFVFANCVSYFVRSGAPYVTGWGMRPGEIGWFETIGFPFVVYDFSWGGIAPWFYCPRINWLGNFTIATTVSYLSSKCLAIRLPPLWPGQSRGFPYSLRALLSIVAAIGVLLGIAVTSSQCGLFVRNMVCLAGPVLGFAWSWHRRVASWLYLTVAAVALTLLTLTVDFRYQDPPINHHLTLAALTELLMPAAAPELPVEWSDYELRDYALRHVGLAVIRAVVPVFGLLSFLVLASVAHSFRKRGHCTFSSVTATKPATCGPEPRELPHGADEVAPCRIPSPLPGGMSR